MEINSKANTNKVGLMDKVNINGMMALLMKVSLKMDSGMELENGIKIVKVFIMDNFSKIRNMERGLSIIKMADIWKAFM